MPDIDSAFTALPMRELADAALSKARQLGVRHADIRVERLRAQDLALRDAKLETLRDSETWGFAVRVVHNGTWGFAASTDLTPASAAAVAERAVEVSKVASALNSESIELAEEPVHSDAVWYSTYQVNPFDVPDSEKMALLTDWSERLLSSDGVTHTFASLEQVQENKFYADLTGTTTTQQRIRVQPRVTATSVDATRGKFDTMRTCAPPAGRGYEYLTGTGWDWDAELAQIPSWLAEKMKAPSVTADRYDLVIDPTNLWLTIHESIGHATELDRALGYEAAYAGTSFATFDKLGSLQYGSTAMNVVGDRTAENGLASIGYDDEGVQTQRWDLIKDGVLVGYQIDRRMAKLTGLGRSNGCAFADSPGHVPLQRMPNVSLQPAPDGPSMDDLISAVDHGIYIVGDNSWSIDMQRYNFQFTAQRFFEIRGGRIVGQLRDVAYQATTTDFWGSLEAVGGPDTYLLGGAFNCGKGQPGQVAPVSHGCPPALFRNINVLNAVKEAGR